MVSTTQSQSFIFPTYPSFCLVGKVHPHPVLLRRENALREVDEFPQQTRDSSAAPAPSVGTAHGPEEVVDHPPRRTRTRRAALARALEIESGEEDAG